MGTQSIQAPSPWENDPLLPPGALGRAQPYQWWWVVSTVVSFTPCFFAASITCSQYKANKGHSHPGPLSLGFRVKFQEHWAPTARSW